MNTASIDKLFWRPGSAGVVVQGDALVQLWERESPAEGFRAIQRWCAARPPGRPLWMMSVVSEHAAMPDNEARKVASEFPRYFTEFVMVIEGAGFRASMVRSVLAGMAMLAPRRTAPHIVSTVSEGSAQLARLSANALDAGALESLVRDLRAQLR